MTDQNELDVPVSFSRRLEEVQRIVDIFRTFGYTNTAVSDLLKQLMERQTSSNFAHAMELQPQATEAESGLQQ